MPTHTKTIDIRKLLARGIEPLPHIRTVVDSLKAGQELTVVAPFLPSPLIEKLKGEGFQCRPERQSDGSWLTRFWRD